MSDNITQLHSPPAMYAIFVAADGLDPADVVPIVRQAYPSATDAEICEAARVAGTYLLEVGRALKWLATLLGTEFNKPVH